MAVVLAFRVGIALTPVLYRAASSGQPSTLQHLQWGAQWLWDRLNDPDESDEDLSAALSEASGTVVVVATYNSPFELRKLQVLFKRTSGTAIVEDNAVCTFHFAKLASGVPTDAWLAADFTTIETAFNTFWAAIADRYRVQTILDQYRWYATGPQIDIALGGPGRTGPPRRIVDVEAPGTHTTTGVGALPPQVALSVTEQTTDPKAWGRFYLPALAAEWVTAYGRVHSTAQTAIANAADTFYEACRTANTPVVVYSAAKEERLNKHGDTLPAKAARALSVDQLQVDDLYDVIRSRRWNAPTLKLQRAIGS